MQESSLPLDYARQPSIYAEVGIAMFRRKTVLTQGLCEEKSVYDSFNKLIGAQIRGTTISSYYRAETY